VYSIKGKKQVGVASSAERGQLMTVVCCMSAAGTFVPPTMIFPRKKINPNFRKNLPPDTYCLPSETGWINTNLFLKWLEFFVEQVRPSESRKALIILDNHESHRSLEAIEFARKNHIVLLSVPPHTTHKLQPLDVSLFSSFKNYMEANIAQWQKINPSRTITFHDIGEIFGPSYLSAATPRNAIKGF